MKLFTTLACMIIAHSSAVVECPPNVNVCTGDCNSSPNCRNCEFTCSCDQNEEQFCPDTPIRTSAFCGIIEAESDGCGGTYNAKDCSSKCTPPEECQPNGTCDCKPTSKPLCPTNILVGGDCSDIPPSSDGCFDEYDGDDCSDKCDPTTDAICYLNTCCIPLTTPECPASIPLGFSCSIPSDDDGCGGTYNSRDCSSSCTGFCNSDGQCDCTPDVTPACPVSIPIGSACSVPSGTGGRGGAYNLRDCSSSCAGFCNSDGQCDCTPDVAPACPVSIPIGSACSVPSGPDGCGGSYAAQDCSSYCAGSGVCIGGICQSSCKGCSVVLNGVRIAGTCHPEAEYPANTLDVGPCATGCGTCYISSTVSGLCGGSPHGVCTNGTCGCFKTHKGASCSAANFVVPIPVPLPGNGGGCAENLCNALSTKLGYNTACCPQCY